MADTHLSSQHSGGRGWRIRGSGSVIRYMVILVASLGYMTHSHKKLKNKTKSFK